MIELAQLILSHKHLLLPSITKWRHFTLIERPVIIVSGRSKEGVVISGLLVEIALI